MVSMGWASRRRNKYLGGIAIVVLIIFVWIGISVIYEAPTCFDSERNGNEEGIDCGGSCELVCGFQAVDPIVLWSRFFEVSPGVYNAVALIENPNTNKQAGPTPYTLKIRDAENVLVYERKGSTEIPPERILAIFETGIFSGERVPVRSTFTIDRKPVWEKVSVERPRIEVSDSVLSGEDALPRLDAVVSNKSLIEASDIVLVAILSGTDGNAVAVSRTVVSFLRPGEEDTIVFTWRAPFSTSITSIDVIPILPLSK